MSYFQKVRGNRIPFVENLWKFATIYFQARSVSINSKIRENVAETACRADIALVGIDYGILAYFLLFSYTSLSKIFSIIVSEKSSCACTILSPTSTIYVRFNGNRKRRYANIINFILPLFVKNHRASKKKNSVNHIFYLEGMPFHNK